MQVISVTKKRTKNLFSTTLQALNFERRRTEDKSIEELWRRAGLNTEKSREGYVVTVNKLSTRVGQEITEYVLYKPIDAIRTTTQATVSTDVEFGLPGTKAEKAHARTGFSKESN